MKTFAITTLGCKVNQYESQQIRELLEEFGLWAAKTADKADLVVVNTCCVTHIASAKSRQYIRKAQKQNPQANIIAVGCLPVGQPDELKNIGGRVCIVRRKNDLARVLGDLLQTTPINKRATRHNKTAKFNSEKSLPAMPKLKPLSSYSGRCRAFLKIQDGCDGYCTYCIIPKTRNEISSKPATVVLQEAYNLIYAGHKEIVLTGIFLGAYGQNTVRRKNWDPAKKNELARLVDKIAQVPGLERIRLSSLEPADVTDKLLNVFCKHRNVMPHLHLPLQSGSERILKKMRRQYTVGEFLQVLDSIRLRLDRPAITTDIIVGFPGESDEDFERTMAIAKGAAFAKIHVFSFSARKNTAAAKMQPIVDARVIKMRSRRLRELDEELQAKFRRQFAGEKVGIIVEKTGPVRGRCERYFMVESDEKETAKRGEIGFVWV
jgi:threonylcarbamoyladenosine tRNA methylthiotransferase MtaB